MRYKWILFLIFIGYFKRYDIQTTYELINHFKTKSVLYNQQQL